MVYGTFKRKYSAYGAVRRDNKNIFQYNTLNPRIIWIIRFEIFRVIYDPSRQIRTVKEFMRVY